MAFHDWLSFTLLSFTFCLIPGPSVCFTIAHALRHGVFFTLASIAGQLGSNGLYILAVSVGLDRLVGDSLAVFNVIRFAGAVYLLYLGLRQWRAGPLAMGGGTAERAEDYGALRGFIRGFIVCGTNPKTLLYYAAILPPFISPAHNRGVQLAILGTTTVAVGGIVLLLYALLAGRVRNWLASECRLHLRNRLAAGLMIVAAMYLSMRR